MKRLDEFALIRKWTKQGQTTNEDPNIEVGIGDDAAVVSVSEGMRLVTTCDTMVETIHFNRLTMQPEHIGFKALAVNVSDIAAMGGIPKFALVSLSIPKTYSPKKLEQLYKGLYACAEQYDVKVVGGDTTSSPRHLVVSVTVIGEVEPRRARLRSSAEPGHVVFVTGTLGDSAAGFQLLNNDRSARTKRESHPYARLIAAHQRPQPRVEAGRILLTSGMGGALNDISDGLASELHEISEASGWEIRLEESLLPCSQELENYAASIGVNPLDWMLFGGEDYYLVGTAKRAHVNDLKQDFYKAGIPFYIVGEVTDSKTRSGSVKMNNRLGESLQLEKKGFNHF